MALIKRWAVIKIVLVYALVSALWIYFSDWFLSIILGSIGEIFVYSVYKGFAFIIITSTGLYWLMRREFKRQQAGQDALRESEEKFRQVFEQSGDSNLLMDEHGFLDCNQAAVRLLRAANKSQIIGKNPADVSPEYQPDGTLSAEKSRQYNQGAWDGEIQHFEWVMQALNGDRYNVDVTLSRIIISGKSVLYAVVHDLSEIRGAQEALRQSEANLRVVFESSPEAIVLLNKEMRVVTFNRVAVSLAHTLFHTDLQVGMTAEEIIGNEHQRGFINHFADALKGNAVVTMNKFEIESNPIWLELFYNPVFSGNGEVQGVCFTAADVTDKKRSEEALRLSQEHLERIVETVPSGIVIMNTAGSITFANQAAERILGLSWSGISQLKYNDPGWQIASIEGHPFPDENLPFARVMQSQQAVFGVEHTIVHPNGVKRFLRINAAPLRNSSGQLVGVVTSLDDVSSERRAEIEVQRQVHRLAALRTIDTAINANLELPVILSILLHQVIGQLGVDAACVARYVPEEEHLIYMADLGFAKPFSPQAEHPGAVAPFNHSDAKQAIRRKEMFHRSADAKTGSQNIDCGGETFVEYFCVPFIAKGEVKGVLEVYHRNPLKPDGEWVRFLESLAGQAAIAMDHADLYVGLQKSNLELMTAYEATLEGWSKALELRDRETQGHSRRVTNLTLRLAIEMGIPEDELVHVRRGALLHDIGKLGVPDHILLKPDRLNEDDRLVMNRHPEYAYQMLSQIPYLTRALDIPYCHHERWDGMGYPRGMKGEEIPLSARIFALVDVWDALLSDRPYRPAWPIAEVWHFILSERGKHFDPHVLDVFKEIVEQEGW